MISPFLQTRPRTQRDARMDTALNYDSRWAQLFRNAPSDYEAMEMLLQHLDWFERGLRGRTMHTVEGEKLERGLVGYIADIRSDIQFWQDKLAEKEAVE